MLRLLTGGGGVGSEQTEKDCCFMVFISKGVDTLEVLVTTIINARSHIAETVKNIAQLFYNNLVGGAVGYNGEVDEVVPEASLCLTAQSVRFTERDGLSTLPKCFSAENAMFTL